MGKKKTKAAMEKTFNNRWYRERIGPKRKKVTITADKLVLTHFRFFWHAICRVVSHKYRPSPLAGSGTMVSPALCLPGSLPPIIMGMQNQNRKKHQQAKNYRCRCRGHGSPEIIDPCIRELVDCLNRHGVETLSSCCGHGSEGDIILGVHAVKPNIVASGDQMGWLLRLAPKQIQLPYDDEACEWKDEYPTGGRNLSAITGALNASDHENE
jgi:hypothetical protein